MDSYHKKPQIGKLYSALIKTGRIRGITSDLWDRVPTSLLEAHKLAVEVRRTYGTVPDDIEELKKAVENQLRRWGILTSRVRENIGLLEKGVVEAGQQPMCLGGPSLILNKIACAKKICELKGDDPLIPMFYVADYDGVHNELLNIRVPSPSSRGLLISISENEQSGIPIYKLPTPSEKWLRQTVERIKSNYKGLLKGISRDKQEHLFQNLNHAITILKNAYYSSENISEWSTKIQGFLLNIESDLGVPVLSFSTPQVRPLFQSGYETMLMEPFRSRFINASNKAVETIEKAGYKAQIGLRDKNYVPFFLECMNKHCNRMRIGLKYGKETGASSAYIAGKCISCDEDYEFSFNAKHPDLSEVIDWISPRVDSRQIIVDSLIPVVAHIGGPGETSYYAEVIPAIKSLKLPTPIFVRYTRTFYNTSWNQKYSENLVDKGYTTLINKNLFSALNAWVNARNTSDEKKLVEAHKKIRRNIESTYEKLLKGLHDIESDINSIKKQLHELENRSTLFQQFIEKQKLSRHLELYLSSAFGRFSPERFGQEVSWSWLDLAVMAGVGDIMGVFLRQYNKYTPVSAMFYVNL